MSTIYIASSWKNQHAVEMLTWHLRKLGHEVISWVENNYGEDHNHVTKKFDFETWVSTKDSDQSFKYDTGGAANCDLFIYLGPAGKDAAAECGICYGRKMFGQKVYMAGLWAKGEDFGLMRKMFDGWFTRVFDLLQWVLENFPVPGHCRMCGCTEENPCHHPDHGTCWWSDVDHTICSHCDTQEIAEDPITEHPSIFN